MKNKSGTMILTCLTAVVLMTSGMAFGETLLTTTLRTDKTFYLMDPFHWVYTAPDTVWPDAGNDRTVTFNVNIYDGSGFPTEVTDVSFEVYDADVLFDSGDVLPTGTPGSYQGSFDLTETNLGAAAFSGQVPKELLLKISTAADGLIKEHPVSVGRWGCDRCHVGAAQAQVLYDWCVPAGGPGGPHNWTNILGGLRDHGGFTINFLTTAEHTHTPANVLLSDYGHERTNRKYSILDCSPCHAGYGYLREAYSVSAGKSQAVECTFCHGIDGGYAPVVPDSDPVEYIRWADNAGYISAGHRHEKVPLLPAAPYQANQTCSNPGCHGHIEDGADGDIHHNKPNCRDCHGIHNDNF